MRTVLLGAALVAAYVAAAFIFGRGPRAAEPLDIDTHLTSARLGREAYEPRGP